MSIKPLVFIPGFPASELRQLSTGRAFFPPSLGDLLSDAKKAEIVRLLSGPDVPPGDIVPGEPIRSFLQIGKLEIGKLAASLYDILRTHYNYTIDSGDNFRHIGWDWRDAIDASRVQNDVAGKIEELSAANGGAKVVVLAHSTGGLILRRLLEQRPALTQKIEQILAFGIPWIGTLAAVKYLIKGEKFGLGPASLDAARVRDVMRRCQAAYDLFPPDPGKTDMHSPSGQAANLFVATDPAPRHQVGPLVDLTWVRPADPNVAAKAGLADARLGTRPSTISIPGFATPPITNIAGWGVEMETTCVLGPLGGITFEKTKESDGTIPTVSASWLRGPGVRTFFVPIGLYPGDAIPFHHDRIWDSPPVRQLFDEVLVDRERRPYVHGSADIDEAIDAESDLTIRLVAADSTGQPLPDARFQFRGLTAHPQSFANHPRIDVRLPKDLVRPDSQRVVRMTIDVTWGTGGPNERGEVSIVYKR